MSLGKASIKAAKWSLIATFARFALQIIAQVILARLLGPANYGLFGIGMIVYTFGNFFSSFGFGRQLLQKPVITDEDIRFAFTWQVVTGVTATLVILAAAPWLAEYFKEPKVLPVIQWLSLACVLNAATAPANNLLQRDMNFKKSGIIQFVGYGVGFLGLGIPLAMAGYEVFALVTAWLAQAVIVLIGTYIARPHSIKPLLWFEHGRNAVSYGWVVFVTNIVNWLLNNLDRVVIGRLLNIQSVGFYTIAYNLGTMPNTLLLGNLQTVFLAAGAKTEGNLSRLRDGYLQVLATILVIVMPVFAFLSVMSPNIIALLYGTRWQASGHVLSILFIGMPALIICGLSTPVLWNTAREKYEFLLQMPVLLAGAAALYAFGDLGLTVVAWIAVAIMVVRAIVVAGASIKALDISFVNLLGDAGRGVLLSILSYWIAKFGIMITAGITLPIAAIVVSSIFAIVIFMTLAWFFPKILGNRTCAMLARFLPVFATR